MYSCPPELMKAVTDDRYRRLGRRQPGDVVGDVARSADRLARRASRRRR